ncbi:hypothetical protein ACFXTO_026433 [Malus domestica]
MKALPEPTSKNCGGNKKTLIVRGFNPPLVFATANLFLSRCAALIPKCEDNEDAKLVFQYMNDLWFLGWKKAERFMKLISQVPGQLGFSLLQSLLGACRIHENVEMGERVSDGLMGLQPTESDAYVQMSN